MYPVSARFKAAVAGVHTAVAKVEVRNNNGILLLDVTQYLQTGGTISADETRQVRRTGSLTLGGLPLSLIPDNEGDLLHPSSGNELWVYRGIQYSDGTDEFAQLGVFRMTKPVLTDSGDSVTMAFSLQDRSSFISRTSWLTPYVIAAGTNLGTALKAALASRWPAAATPLTYNFAPTTAVVPATTWGASPGQTNDPMADMIKLASDCAGMELFFDWGGVPTLRSIPDPTTSPVVATFVESPTCPMTSLQRSLDETQQYNGVQLYCNGTGAAGPFVVTVWDTDPTSKTYYLGPWGQSPYQMTTTSIPVDPQTLSQAQAQATTSAQAQLQLILKAFDATQLEAAPDPSWAEGDCATLVRARLKVNGNYVMSALTIPLDPESAETIVNRPQRQTS